jgi:trehalose-6-phosphate synthase
VFRGSVRTSPVSVSPSDLDAVLRHPVTASLVQRERRATAVRTLVVGVDRIDYTKGVVERLWAYDVAFSRGWLHPDRTRIVQIAQPTRRTLDEYKILRVETERVAHELASRWRRSDGSSPVEVVIDTVDRRRVLALLSLADVCTITPIRDGMNLVAKEFSILNERHGGVLVMTRGAGAADALGDGAVVVEEVTPAAIAAGLERAVTLPDETRRQWAARRAAAVRAWTASDWADDFLGALGATGVGGAST